MDPQDMGVNPSAGNRHLHRLVDKASQTIVFACPLRNKDNEGVEDTMWGLVLMFGVPCSIWGDLETAFMAEVVQHLFRRLQVLVSYGPADRFWDLGSVERLGACIPEALSKPCKSWPIRWDEYVQPALWPQRTKPLPWPPGSPTPFRLRFGRGVLSPVDAIAPEFDGSDFLQHCGLRIVVADRKEPWREVTGDRNAVGKRHEL